MWVAVLFTWGTLLTVCVSQSCPEGSDDAATWVRLKPLGNCRDGESTCLYRITMPPLTIQLPRPSRELEKMARELRSLMLMVNQLKEDCQECKERQRMRWSVRTEDGDEDGERVQASRGTVNTKERQQDIARRVSVFQVTNSNSEGEDMTSISNINGIKEKNSVVEKQGEHANLERNVYTSPSGQHVETNEGPNGSIFSHMEIVPDHMGKIKELHTLTAEEGRKDLQSLKAKPTESSFPGNQEEEQSGHHEKHPTYILRAGLGENTSGTLTAQGKVESIPEISVVSTVTEDAHAETKQMNSTYKDEQLRKYAGFPRLSGNNKKAVIKPNPNTENRLKNPGVMRRGYSPVGNRTIKVLPKVNGFNPRRVDSNTEDHKTIPDRVRNVSGERKPKTGPTIQTNRDLKQNMTKITRTLLDWQKKVKENVRGPEVKEPESFIHEEVGNKNVAKEGSPSVLPFPDSDADSDTPVDLHPVDTDVTVVGLKETTTFISEMTALNRNSENVFNPGKDEDSDPSKPPVLAKVGTTGYTSRTNPLHLDTNSDHLFYSGTNAEIDTDEDLSPGDRSEHVSRLMESRLPVSEKADVTMDFSHTTQQTLDSNSENLSATNAESDSGVDAGLVRRVEKVTGLKMPSLPNSDKFDDTVHNRNSQVLDSNHELAKGQSQLKSDSNNTRARGQNTRGSAPMKAETNGMEAPRNNKAVPFRPVKQVPLTGDKSRVVKAPVSSMNKPGLPSVGQTTRGGPRSSGGGLRIQEANLHANSTKYNSGIKELNQPNTRMVKNVTRVTPNYLKPPERTHPTRMIISKNPRLRRPYILHRLPSNGSVEMPLKVPGSGEVKNISDTTEHKMDIMDSGRNNVHSTTGHTSSSSRIVPEKPVNGMTHLPTVLTNKTVDDDFGDKVKTAPTVEPLNPLVNQQIENSSQKTKVVHPAEIKSQEKRRKLDPIRPTTDGVRERGVEAVINQDTLNFDSNNVSGRDSHPAAVEKNKDSDRGKEKNPFKASSVDFNQENNKKPLRPPSLQRSSTKIPPTVDNMSTERKDFSHPTTTATVYTVKNIIVDDRSGKTQYTTPTPKAADFRDQDNLDKVKATSGVKMLDTNVHYTPKTSSPEAESRNLERSNPESQNKNTPFLQKTVKAEDVNQETVVYANSLDIAQNGEMVSHPVVMDRDKDSTVAQGSVSSTASTSDAYSANSNTSIITAKLLEGNNGDNARNSYPLKVDRAEDRVEKTKDIAKNKEKGLTDPTVVQRNQEKTLMKESTTSTASTLTSDTYHDNSKPPIITAKSLKDNKGDSNRNLHPPAVDRMAERVKKTKDTVQNKEKGSTKPIAIDRNKDSKLVKESAPTTTSTVTSDAYHNNGKTPIISAEPLQDNNGDNNNNLNPPAVGRTENRVKETIDSVQNKESISKPRIMDRNKGSKLVKGSSPVTTSTDAYHDSGKTPIIRAETLRDNNGDSHNNLPPMAVDRTGDKVKETVDSVQSIEMGSKPSVMDRNKDSKLVNGSAPTTTSTASSSTIRTASSSTTSTASSSTTSTASSSTTSTASSDAYHKNGIITAESLEDNNGHNNNTLNQFAVDMTENLKKTNDSVQNKERGSTNPMVIDRNRDSKLMKMSTVSPTSSVTSDVYPKNGKAPIISGQPLEDNNGDNSHPLAEDRTENRVKETIDSVQNKERGLKPGTLVKGSTTSISSSLTSDAYRETGTTPVMSAESQEDNNGKNNGKAFPHAVDLRVSANGSKLAKGSAPTRASTSTSDVYSGPGKPPTISAEVLESNNQDKNGNSYLVSMDTTEDIMSTRVIDSKKTIAKGNSKGNNEGPFNIKNTEDRDDVENQLLTTCHGECELGATSQPALNVQRSSDNDRDKQPQDCSDLTMKETANGIYSVISAGPKNNTFRVFCDMEASGGGWTLIQRRFDGSVSFNRTWADYKRGFGSLTGEFWLGNDKIHWLTSAKAMVLRIELEDLDGVKEYAQYHHFQVGSERQLYKLTIGGYTGTAGNALLYNKRFNHNQKYFTTPDRDNDQYPSGNCGAYYSSGWWFDACMAANLNGKYYHTRYKGVRNGIFWGTWQNITDEYYPTNERQSFKTVRMMIKPRMFF